MNIEKDADFNKYANLLLSMIMLVEPLRMKFQNTVLREDPFLKNKSEEYFEKLLAVYNI